MKVSNKEASILNNSTELAQKTKEEIWTGHSTKVADSVDQVFDQKEHDKADQIDQIYIDPEGQEEFTEISRDDRTRWTNNNTLLSHRITNWHAHSFSTMLRDVEMAILDGDK